MRLVYSTVTAALLLAFALPQTSVSQSAQVSVSKRNNTSIPLRQMPPANRSQSVRAPFEIPNKWRKFGGAALVASQPEGFVDPVLQQQQGQLAPTIGTNFEGSSDDDNAAVLGFRVVPPDTDGDVGPNHYVQWINSVSEIFNKSGATLAGPFAGNQYFQGMGGICDSENDGDPIVLYDERADRWLVSQFAVPGGSNSICVAISMSPDPTDRYHQYEFSFGSDFPDYPKLGIWGDSYVMTTRDFAGGVSWAGISAVALDRTAMLSGASASMVRFPNAFSSINDGALPADADGAVLGPAVFGAHGNDGDTTFELWELDVDWSNPGAATFSSIPGVGISAYDASVPSANQPNGQVLDDLSSFTMHRLNVRDFGSHYSMVANHSVEASTGVIGVRWYEFRDTGSGWSLYQEGTVSPDSDDRWMGSIAINAAGDIALGYSRSSSSLFPSIYFTGQTADQSGTGVMNVAETVIQAGGGAQSGAARWGDYSMMSVDPSDDSFWFTTEYYAATGSFDFNTRIANFELGTSTPATSVHVEAIAQGTQSAPKGRKYATASVTVRTDTGLPVAGYDVTGNFSGSINETGVTATTNSSGVALLVTEGSARSKNYNVDFCVSGVSGTLPYVPGDNADAGFSCGPVGDPTDVHIASISTGTSGAGGGNKYGTATVTVVDDLGNPASGYSVAGLFSGDVTGSPSGVTNSNGTVTFQSDNTGRGKVNVGFCVSTVTGALPYDPSDNASGSYACAGSNIAAKSAIDNSDFLLSLSNAVPDDYALGQNYPNPFTEATIVAFGLPEAGHVSIRVYNIQGQEITTLVDDFREAGVHRVGLNATEFSAGIYLYVMQSGDYRATQRMTLVK